MSAIIETRGLVMQFPSTRALDVLDVSIPSGVTGLVGANGAGKTTLISLVLGLLTPTSGSISVLGLDPAHEGPEPPPRSAMAPNATCFPTTCAPTTSCATLRRRRAFRATRREPGERLAVPGRPRRGAIPGARHDVDRTAPTCQARPGDRRRPPADRARRTDRRTRSRAARTRCRTSSCRSTATSGST